MDPDLIDSYDYVLPPERIADHPSARRDAARLLTTDRKSQTIRHRTIGELPQLLKRGDVLVFNETRVLPARLQGFRTKTGGKWEGLFLATAEDGAWRIIGKTRGRLAEGETITIPCPADARGLKSTRRDTKPLMLTLESRGEEGEWGARPDVPGSPAELLEQFGSMPLPPYIHREQPRAEDRERYQTVFARTPGAVAAPTAGLHFTPELLAACEARGIERAFVTLHVGLGTFRPVTTARLSEHVMHSEWCALPEDTVAAIAGAPERGGRVIAVGTTVVRTLESVAARGPLAPWQGETDLLIRPPYEFRVVDALLTNFHLPRSTLLALVYAFGGRDFIRRAYETAIADEYRFYSYGDAMLIE
jgi:S-adenosylmethionine:tRNA ribosyltransferase-isomerase